MIERTTYHGKVYTRDTSNPKRRAFARKDGLRQRREGQTFDERKTVYLHRIIWITEVGPIPTGMIVIHKDNNPSNNNLSNLMCVTDPIKNRIPKKERPSPPQGSLARSCYTMVGFKE